MAEVTMPEVDPAIAARAAELAQRTEEVDQGAPYGRDGQGRPNVPGFTSNEPMVAQDMHAPEPQPVIQETPQQESDRLPQFESDTTGIESLLTEEELEDEVEEATPPVLVDEEEENEFEEPEVAKAKKREKQLEKERNWYKEQWLNQGRKNWRAEVKRRFPLADSEGIQANTRKDMLRQAKAQHDRIYGTIRPYLVNADADRTNVIQEEREAARAHAAKAYGKPFVGPPEPVIDHARAAEENAALDRSNFKTLQDRTRALVRSGKLSI